MINPRRNFWWRAEYMHCLTMSFYRLLVNHRRKKIETTQWSNSSLPWPNEGNYHQRWRADGHPVPPHVIPWKGHKITCVIFIFLRMLIYSSGIIRQTPNDDPFISEGNKEGHSLQNVNVIKDKERRRNDSTLKEDSRSLKNNLLCDRRLDVVLKKNMPYRSRFRLFIKLQHSW